MTAAAAADKETGPRREARKRSNALGRLRTGEAIYLVAAILLFVLMFFQWYGPRHSGPNSELVDLYLFGGGTAWQALELVPLFLMLAIVVAVGAAILRLSGSDWKPAISPPVVVCLGGLMAAALILIRIIWPPGIEQLEGLPIERSLEVGIFLAFAAALGIAYGGWRAMAEEGASFAGVAKRLESPRRPARKKPVPAAKPATATKAATAAKGSPKKAASPRRTGRKKP